MIQLEHNKKPPIYDRCVEVFGIDWNDGVIFAYGDTIYCKYEVSDYKLIHEAVHIKQQNGNPEEWWNKYFVDPKFRFEQELEAYREESKYLNKTIKDRNTRFKIIDFNARCLSSSMYGNLVSYSEALNLIK